MSIWIEGLTLPPVGVRQCVVAVSGGHLLISDVCGNTLFEGKYIEISTPHGRLIDADAFEKKLKRLANSEGPYQRGIGKAFLTAISCEPTIIEAEVSENA